MKKLLALIFIFALVMCMAACGADKKDDASSSDASSTVSKTDTTSSVTSTTSSKDETSSESNTSSEASKPTASSKPAATAKNNLDKFLESQKDELKAMEDSMAGSGMKMKIYGENGNTIVYKYTYETQLDAATAKPLLEDALDEAAATFKYALTSIKSECSAVTKLKVIYVNADGKTITSRTFK